MPNPVAKEMEYFISCHHKKHIIGLGKNVFSQRKGLLFWIAKIF